MNTKQVHNESLYANRWSLLWKRLTGHRSSKPERKLTRKANIQSVAIAEKPKKSVDVYVQCRGKAI